MTETKVGIEQVDNRPDFPALERDLLAWWERDGIVEAYLRRNGDSPERYSFLDGPITANNPMDWDLLLPHAEFTHNPQPHSMIRTSPFYTMMGYEP